MDDASLSLYILGGSLEAGALIPISAISCQIVAFADGAFTLNYSPEEPIRSSNANSEQNIGRESTRDQSLVRPPSNSPGADRYSKGTYFATCAIAGATICSLAAALIQAFIFSKQLDVMQGQLDEMKRTADADLPNIQTGIRVDQELYGTSEPKSFISTVWIDLWNYGKTAAITQRINLDWRVSAKLQDKPSYDLDYTDPQSSSIAASGTRVPIQLNQHQLNLTKRQLDRAILHDDVGEYLWIFGYIDYVDFSNRQYRIGYCGRWYPIPGKKTGAFDSRDCPEAYLGTHELGKD